MPMYNFNTFSNSTEDMEKNQYELSDPHPDLHLYPPVIDTQATYDYIEDIKKPQNQTQTQHRQSSAFVPVNAVSQPMVFANPGPLGLMAFASTTLILSLYNVGARGITIPNVVVGQAIAVGGLGQILAGIGDFFVGNTFGATAFTLFGGFWLSYACILLPTTGIIDAYTANPDDAAQLANGLGIWLMVWFVITFILWLGTFRTTLAKSAVFFFLFITFAMLSAANFTGRVGVLRAAGSVGIITALTAFYAAAVELYLPHYT
ncbi:hypothetical protein FRB96_000790 [Tulasnella sp. 330]|nr:hypothetical protein FRB96_000790 [Tulasnella sp. 330]KAG8882522.1 hypothetical protein FRB97_008148 [Tulasnella sp. 331]KAG8888856.1 hypothetical protein FRB98_006642 [Tulasnella sp. 332]